MVVIHIDSMYTSHCTVQYMYTENCRQITIKEILHTVMKYTVHILTILLNTRLGSHSYKNMIKLTDLGAGDELAGAGNELDTGAGN
jgi:hypothetical protein